MTNKIVTDTKEDVQREVKKGLDALRRLRDEARVRVHLAGMDAQVAWSKLEPLVDDAETLAKDASTSALETIKSLISRIESVIASSGKSNGKSS